MGKLGYNSFMFVNEKNSLFRVTSQLRESFKERLKAVIAFGSRVRGDFHGESDFDVLVVVDKLSVDDEIKIIRIFSEEEAQTGIPYEPVIKSLAVFEKERLYKTGFYRNIMKEGVIFFDSIIRGQKSTCKL